eukprot:98029_1
MSRFSKFLASLTTPPPSMIDPRVKYLNSVTDEYDRARPLYSPMIFSVMEPLFKDHCKTIANIGAGTGQLTSLLTHYMDPSTKIYAVEPLLKLREKLTENFSNFTNVEICDNLAENLSLIEDNTIDAVFCESFHWFANMRTVKEFERVLSGEDSYLMFVWNKLLWNDNQFLQEVQRVMSHEHNRDDSIRRKVQRLLTPQNLIDHDIKSFGRFTYKELKRTHQHKIDGVLFLELLVSMTSMQSVSIEQQCHIIDQVKECILRHYGSFQAEIAVPYSTVVTFAKCNKSDT